MCTISQLCFFLWSLLSFLLVFPCFFSKGIGLCITLVHSMNSNFVWCICIMYLQKGLTFYFLVFWLFFTIKLCMYLLHFCSYIISYHLNVRYSHILFYKCFHILFYIEFSKPSGIFFAVCTNVKIYLVLFSKCLNLPGAAVSSQFLCSSLQRALLRSKPTCCLSSPSFLSDASCQHHQWLYTIRSVGPCLVSDSLARHPAPSSPQPPASQAVPSLSLCLVLLTILSFSVDFTPSQCRDSSLPTPVMVLPRHMALNKIPVFWLPDSHLEAGSSPLGSSVRTPCFSTCLSGCEFQSFSPRAALCGIIPALLRSPYLRPGTSEPRWPLSPAHTWLPLQEIC